MNKTIIKVPSGVKFISDWKDYELPEGHVIVDKGVTGCGYTEFCLRNGEPLILCSPRKLLLQNKAKQHLLEGHTNIFYLQNDITSIKAVSVFKKRIEDHLRHCFENGFIPKFLITYDSLHYLLDYLKEIGMFTMFRVVVDEFQSIFLDSYFKCEVELDLIDTLQDCHDVVYLSATPMMDKYLERLDEFKNLDFHYLDWSGSEFIEKVTIYRRQTTSLFEECCKIIEDYLNGNYPKTYKDGKLSESKEAIFYFNSITEIIKVVDKMGLTRKNTRIICANTADNRHKLKKLDRGFKPEEVPLRGETNPMFMFCTSTVYVGVDMYSKCAKSYIFADANISSLSLDIALDLPQIMGRQRDISNPFKNEATIFYKTLRKSSKIYDKDEFDRLQEIRRQSSTILLDSFSQMNKASQSLYLEKIRSDIKVSKYKNDLISVSKLTNKPVWNPLIEIAHERSWEVAQEDFQDSINVTRSFQEQGYEVRKCTTEEERLIDEFLSNEFFKTNIFAERLRMYCEFMDKYGNQQGVKIILNNKINDPRFDQYYSYYGTTKCKAVRYRENLLAQGWTNDLLKRDLEQYIRKEFKTGEVYSKKDLKESLNRIYTILGIKKKAKATDLEEYFTLKQTKITLDDLSTVHAFRLT